MKSRVEFLDHQPEDDKCPICDGSGRCRPCSGSGDFETFRAVLAEDLAKAPVQVVTKDELREAAEDEDEDDVGEIAPDVPWYMATLEYVAILSVTVTALWATFRAGRVGASVVEVAAWTVFVLVAGVVVGAACYVTERLGWTEPESRPLVKTVVCAIVSAVGVAIVRRIYP